MHHASAHHHRLVEHGAVGVCGAQGVQAALGQCKVDRAAAGVTMQARVAAALEHLDAPAALGEQGGEQGAGEAGADDGEGFRVNVTQVGNRSEEHTSELQSLMRISYAVLCLKKKTTHNTTK